MGGHHEKKTDSRLNVNPFLVDARAICAVHPGNQAG
jgi:hypothetical protein